MPSALRRGRPWSLSWTPMAMRASCVQTSRTSIEKKKADWLKRLNEVRAEFKLQDPFAGMDGLEYQRWIRGDGPEV